MKDINYSEENTCSNCSCCFTKVSNQNGIQLFGKKILSNNALLAIRFSTGAILLLLGILLNIQTEIEILIFGMAYIITGYDVVWRAFKNLIRGNGLDETLLMTIATVGAFVLNELPEAVAVMLFYQLGELLQMYVVEKSRRSISELMDIRPDYANLKKDNLVEKVSPDDVKVGDIIVVKPGEKVPLDGIVIEGASMLDTSSLTGEAIPRTILIGDEVLSGVINLSGLICVEVTKVFSNSTVAKILELVQEAENKKSVSEKFITKFAKYYTPIVVALAFLISVLPPLILGEEFGIWIKRALIFLVISCPCALLLSIPVGFLAGLGAASRKGILIKGGNFLEALSEVETVVFDKTGTLTKGQFVVSEVVSYGEYNEAQLLRFAAACELNSSHPIALSIVRAYYGGDASGKFVIDEKVFDTLNGELSNVNEYAGIGVSATFENHDVLVGNERLFDIKGIELSSKVVDTGIIHIAIDGKEEGYLKLEDEIKQDAKATIVGLRSLGIKKVVMLTGDIKSIAERISSYLGLDEVFAQLLPDMKVLKLNLLESTSRSGKTVFVGDGINDAPVLAQADIGIAMGGIGSDAAIEAADVVLMNDEPSSIVIAMKISRFTKQIVWQNIVLVFVIKAIVMALGAGGLATMWEAVFADVGAAVLAVLNSMRILRKDFRL